jgi:hypothetical protein
MPNTEDQNCDYCGAAGVAPWFRFVCPECGRDGCPECMPEGRGVRCPECEQGENDASDRAE